MINERKKIFFFIFLFVVAVGLDGFGNFISEQGFACGCKVDTAVRKFIQRDEIPQVEIRQAAFSCILT